MNRLRRFSFIALLLALVSAASLSAQTATVAGAPTTIDYQGKALDPAGNALANTAATNYEMIFRIWDAQENGAIIWAEKQVVTVSKGLFSVRIGEGIQNGTDPRGTLSEAFNGRERFLGVTIIVPPLTSTTSTEILPRLAFLATPFAYVANKSVSAERLVLNSSTSAPPSSVNLSQVSHAYSSTATNTTLTDASHTWSVSGGSGTDAAPTSTTITLPGVTTRREYYIFKYDNTANPVLIQAPSGGTINGRSAIKLKVMGDGVVIQNTDNNNWWIISDTRDTTPVGTVISSAQNSNIPPPGYLYCNGTAYSRTDLRYTELYASVGTAWGYPDATKFRVPDMRGVFQRGVDGARGYDKDTANRIASGLNGNSGDAVGSYQGDDNRSHDHTIPALTGTAAGAGDHNHGGGGGAGQRGLARQSLSGENRTTDGSDTGASGTELDVISGTTGIPSSGNHTHSVTTSSSSTGSTGALETRPKNVGVHYFIKY